jgi:hypothetical protein
MEQPAGYPYRRRQKAASADYARPCIKGQIISSQVPTPAGTAPLPSIVSSGRQSSTAWTSERCSVATYCVRSASLGSAQYQLFAIKVDDDIERVPCCGVLYLVSLTT